MSGADIDEDWWHLTQEYQSTTGVIIVQIERGRMFTNCLRAVCGDCESAILWNGVQWGCTGELCKRDYSKIKSSATVQHETNEPANIAAWVSEWTGIPVKNLVVEKK